MACVHCQGTGKCKCGVCGPWNSGKYGALPDTDKLCSICSGTGGTDPDLEKRMKALEEKMDSWAKGMSRRLARNGVY